MEPNPALREVAARRAEATGSPAVFVDGTADALPLADASVDVLVCERCCSTSTTRMPRCASSRGCSAPVAGWRCSTRTGRRRSCTRSTRRCIERYRAFSLTQWANPFSGRLLRGQLLAAGLAVDPDVGSSALVLPDDALREGGMLGMAGPAAVEAGAVTPEELDGMVTAISSAAERGEAFVSVTMFGVIGRRPG